MANSTKKSSAYILYTVRTCPLYSPLLAKQFISQLGPVIRINPNEVHIKDSSWYSELNANASRIRGKSPWYPSPIAGGSIFSTVQHALHRRRRAALSHFFSKASVTSLSPLILSKVELLCARFAEKAGTEAVMDLYVVFTGLTLDIISHYSFGETMGLLEDGQFKVAREWKMMFKYTIQTNRWARYFPLIPRVIKLLPDRLALSLIPSIAYLKRLEEVCSLFPLHIHFPIET